MLKLHTTLGVVSELQHLAVNDILREHMCWCTSTPCAFWVNLPGSRFQISIQVMSCLGQHGMVRHALLSCPEVH